MDITDKRSRKTSIVRNRGKNFYLERASDDLWSLIVYFDVTRPRFRKEYKDENGEFSKRMVLDSFNEFNRLRSIKHQTSEQKIQFGRLSRLINLTFGIPHELVDNVLGVHRDCPDGKQHRISLEDVLPIVESRHGRIDILHDGRKCKFWTSKDGKRHGSLLYSYRRRFNIEYVKWTKMLSDGRYSRVSNYSSNRVAYLVNKFERGIEVECTIRERFPKEENDISAFEEKVFKSEMNHIDHRGSLKTVLSRKEISSIIHECVEKQQTNDGGKRR